MKLQVSMNPVGEEQSENYTEKVKQRGNIVQFECGTLKEKGVRNSLMRSMARIRGNRGRLVRNAVMLLFTLDSCWDAETREATGVKSDSAGDGRQVVDCRWKIVMVVVVISCG